MSGVSAKKHLFSGSSSPVVFNNHYCPVSCAFESRDLPKSFYAEPPELSPYALRNMEYLQSLNLFFETSPNYEKSRYSKDFASFQKLFNKSLSFGSNVLGVDFGLTTTGMESENNLVSPRTMIEAPEGISSLHKFLPSNNEEEVSWPTVDTYSCDEFQMYEFKVRRCMHGRSHDWTECPFVHPGGKARRRDPRRFHYSSTSCPDFRKGSCRRGDACEYAHGVFECWLRPTRYCTQPCKDGAIAEGTSISLRIRLWKNL